MKTMYQLCTSQYFDGCEYPGVSGLKTADVMKRYLSDFDFNGGCWIHVTITAIDLDANPTFTKVAFNWERNKEIDFREDIKRLKEALTDFREKLK